MSALSEVGEFIREQRRNAQISLRQLAEQAGVSNPYLSQIERGLRRPSAEVLQQIAAALRISTPVMYLRAGLLEAGSTTGVLGAISGDESLNDKQKHVLIEIYETFRRENAAAGVATAGSAAAQQSAAGSAAAQQSAAGPSAMAGAQNSAPDAGAVSAD